MTQSLREFTRFIWRTQTSARWPPTLCCSFFFIWTEAASRFENGWTVQQLMLIKTVYLHMTRSLVFDVSSLTHTHIRKDILSVKHCSRNLWTFPWGLLRLPAISWKKYGKWSLELLYGMCVTHTHTHTTVLTTIFVCVLLINSAFNTTVIGYVCRYSFVHHC